MLSEEAARRELWISFCALIRAYVAAAQMGSEPALVLVSQPSETELELVGGARSIRLSLEPAAGYWVMHQAPGAGEAALLAEGAFRIGMDSLVEWTGLPGRQPMDAVAEALATLILE